MTLDEGVPELRELEEQTAVGRIFLRALMRRQLGLSLRVAAILAAALAAQPLLAWAWPAYGDLRVLSVPLPWLVLGVGCYPLLVALGLYYVRKAETIDDEFAELLEVRPKSPTGPSAPMHPVHAAAASAPRLRIDEHARSGAPRRRRGRGTRVPRAPEGPWVGPPNASAGPPATPPEP